MTTASFNARPFGDRQPGSLCTYGETPEPTCEKDGDTLRHACEIRRMKDFVGLRRFQAPMPDDFARGMLAPGQDRVSDKALLAPISGALSSVILGLRSLYAGAKPDEKPGRDTPELD